ncbi:uncharacterized protein LOC101848794 [Aplysia californica]|uniref:Uncharacterized protein LOC101848794 n=1 Tax=Aplysia californica TaxID=6500 RepID=A0ABM0JCX6_APLCA|nr:uncharacterized protein LOC101848794 [Aplysia californica]XP_012943114.1 uncharacterized protein LOC101848794 [Aplysia californica]XP_012943116.1 uncharacterized protein LOC101848794 [Aplysia californica]XP_012943119.1 uncharacterized protein LOC101848794 [Aplysia californica]
MLEPAAGCCREAVAAAHVTVGRTRTAQNARSVTMGEQRAPVTAQVLGRMVAVILLVLSHCLTGCAGVLSPLSHTQNLGTHFGNREPLEMVSSPLSSPSSSSPSSSPLDGVSVVDGNLEKSETSEHLSGLTSGSKGWDLVSKTYNDRPKGSKEDVHFHTYLQNLYQIKSGELRGGRVDEGKRLKVDNGKGYLLRSHDDTNSRISIKGVQSGGAPNDLLKSGSIRGDKSSSGAVVKVRNKHSPASNADDVRDKDHFASQIGYQKRIGDHQSIGLSPRHIYGDNTKYSTKYLHGESTGNRDTPISSNHGTENRQAKEVGGRSEIASDGVDSIDIAQLLSGKGQVAEIIASPGVINGVITNSGHGEKNSQDGTKPSGHSIELGEDDFESLQALIQETVHKMVERLDFNVLSHEERHHGSDVSSPPSSSSFSSSSFADTQNGGRLQDPKHQSIKAKHLGDKNSLKHWEKNSTDEHFLGWQEQFEESYNRVLNALLDATVSQSVPENFEFWRNVSSILDSSIYLSRTKRRSPRRRSRHPAFKARFLQHMRRQLAINYGHVTPCEYKDRFYCMNGGTCVIIGTLDIKTCRCPIGFTNTRCQEIDQEYILSLLSNSLVFS